jgi:hypothetical protein
MIYIASVDGIDGRVITIGRDVNPLSTRDFVHSDQAGNRLKAIAAIPHLQHLCRESRRFFAKFRCFEEQLQMPIYFNITKDVLYFRSIWCMDRFLAGTIMLGCDGEKLCKKLPVIAVTMLQTLPSQIREEVYSHEYHELHCLVLLFAKLKDIYIVTPKTSSKSHSAIGQGCLVPGGESGDPGPSTDNRDGELEIQDRLTFHENGHDLDLIWVSDKWLKNMVEGGTN